MQNGGTLNYFAVPWGLVANPLPLPAVVAITVVLMGAVENFRRSGERARARGVRSWLPAGLLSLSPRGHGHGLCGATSLTHTHTHRHTHKTPSRL
jgi:hypothetical protein